MNCFADLDGVTSNYQHVLKKIDGKTYLGLIKMDRWENISSQSRLIKTDRWKNIQCIKVWYQITRYRWENIPTSDENG
jgi:hypothetical protein